MRSYSFFRYMTFLFQLTGIIWLGSGCQVSKMHQTNTNAERPILVTVLADMIVNEDKDGKIVRFVEASPEMIRELRARCGERYTIESVELSELQPLNSSQGLSDFQQRRVILKNTEREGVIIGAELSKYGRTKAEVRASYVHGSSGIGFLYKLSFGRNAWHIVSTTTISAS